MRSLKEELPSMLIAPKETPHLEFKEARTQFDTNKLMKYCTALANEGGGWLVLGLTDKPPRQIVGTTAFQDTADIQRRILDKLGFRVEVEEVALREGRVLGFHCPTRPAGTAYQYEGAYWMRSADELRGMTESKLREIFSESTSDWLDAPAISNMDDAAVVDALDTQTFFELLRMPYPTQQSAVIERLASEKLITIDAGGWTVPRMTAILFAKRLDKFPHEVSRKAVRVLIYDTDNKLHVRTERPGKKAMRAASRT